MTCEKRKHKWTEDGLRCTVCGAERSARQARHVRVERGIYRNTVTGRFEITYTDSDGKQVWDTVEGGITAARQARAEVVSKLGRGERVAPTRRTLRDVGDEWLSTQTQALRPRTKAVYETNLLRHVYPRLGRKRVQDIDENRVAALIAELGETLAPWTVRGVLTVLSRVLGFATRRGMIPANPVKNLERGERPKVEHKEKRVLDDDEVVRLLEAALPNYRALLATAVFTGLRMGELLGLRWQDIDLDAEVLHVRQQLERSGTLGPTKTPQSVREVDLLYPEIVQVLRDHRERMFARGFARPTDHVFTTEAGTPMYWRNVSERGLAKAKRRAGLDEDGKPSLRFHNLRDTNASIRFDNGDDLVYVSKQLGHSSVKVTLDTYAHLINRKRRVEEAKERGKDRWRDKFATSTGGDTRRDQGAGEGSNVAFLHGSATGGDR